MGANDRQVGGDHYKKHGATGEQHWDRQWRLFGPGYFVGCITKYVERYKDKNGVQDLEKAKHFLEKLIELETKAREVVPEAPLRPGGDGGGGNSRGVVLKGSWVIPRALGLVETPLGTITPEAANRAKGCTHCKGYALVRDEHSSLPTFCPKCQPTE